MTGKVIWLLIIALLPSVAMGQNLIALAYHDIRSKWDGDPMTTTADQLQAQLSWLKAHAYHPVSIQDIADANNRRKPLPDKAVLLSFDDGHAGFYEHVFPLLRQFRFPALLALQTGWMATPAGRQDHYGTGIKSGGDFLIWDRIREMAASGLIEVASHGHDLHRGISGNPYGDLQPAATTRRYSVADRRYESDDEFRQRIRTDLQQSSDLLCKYLGRKPKVIVWPYGEFSQETMDIAESVGFSLSVGLQAGNNRQTGMPVIERYLVKHNPALDEFIRDIADIGAEPPIRVAQVDMDYIYDPDAGQIVRNLGKLLDRIKAMHINTVYLQAFSDPNGDGNADAMYFANRHLPVRADLFGHVAWQLATRAQVKVYAWMPALAFPSQAPPNWWVHELSNGQPVLSKHNYRRLSPFYPPARQMVAEIYQDLAKYNHFSGLLFHDDALLTDFEDANPSALQTAKGLPPDQQRWLKIITLTRWTETMANQVRRYRPAIKTARNLYANVVMNPESSAWFAQSLANFLQSYDYTALMAMPFLENAEDPMAWLETLVNKIAVFRQGLKKTVFELQAVDWRNAEKIPDTTLAEQMSLLQQLGALNYGYYPDDFHIDKPSLDMLKANLSLKSDANNERP